MLGRGELWPVKTDLLNVNAHCSYPPMTWNRRFQDGGKCFELVPASELWGSLTGIRRGVCANASRAGERLWCRLLERTNHVTEILARNTVPPNMNLVGSDCLQQQQLHTVSLLTSWWLVACGLWHCKATSLLNVLYDRVYSINRDCTVGDYTALASATLTDALFTVRLSRSSPPITLSKTSSSISTVSSIPTAIQTFTSVVNPHQSPSASLTEAKNSLLTSLLQSPFQPSLSPSACLGFALFEDAGKGKKKPPFPPRMLERTRVTTHRCTFSGRWSWMTSSEGTRWRQMNLGMRWKEKTQYTSCRGKRRMDGIIGRNWVGRITRRNLRRRNDPPLCPVQRNPARRLHSLPT